MRVIEHLDDMEAAMLQEIAQLERERRQQQQQRQQGGKPEAPVTTTTKAPVLKCVGEPAWLYEDS